MGNALLAALTPETFADGLYLFGLACLAFAVLVGALLASAAWCHRADPREAELLRLHAEYRERRRRHLPLFDVAERIGVLTHDKMGKP
jgi:hypothetical protein